MINITRWIDMDGAEFSNVKDALTIKKMVMHGIEVGSIIVDKNGYMKSSGHVIHVEIGSELVGLRYSAKACN